MRHPFVLEPLAVYLRQHLPGFGGELTARQFSGGQSNPAYLLEAGGRRWVLSRKPPGVLLPSAHAVDLEYRLMAALAHSAVPGRCRAGREAGWRHVNEQTARRLK